MGKTTLLKCIMGLLPAVSGKLVYADQDITKLNADRRASLGIGYVPQGREIFSQLTVEENLRIGLSASRSKLKDVPEQLFTMFPVLKKMLRVEAATCRAASSSNSRSVVQWCSSPSF